LLMAGRVLCLLSFGPSKSPMNGGDESAVGHTNSSVCVLSVLDWGIPGSGRIKIQWGPQWGLQEGQWTGRGVAPSLWVSSVG